MAYTSLRVERHDAGVVVVSFDNPPANAFSTVLQQDLDALVSEMESDGTVRAVVFTSTNQKTYISSLESSVVKVGTK